MIYGTLFDMPSASTALASMGEWAKPIFADLLPALIAIVGIFLAIWIGTWIISQFKPK
jgi:uncharacterized membrane protein